MLIRCLAPKISCPPPTHLYRSTVSFSIFTRVSWLKLASSCPDQTLDPPHTDRVDSVSHNSHAEAALFVLNMLT